MPLLTRVAGFVLWGIAATAPGSAASRPSVPLAPPGPGAWYTLTLAIPSERICEAADLPLPSFPENLLFNLVRVLHERPLARADLERGRAGPVLRVLRSTFAHPDTPAGPAGTLVPLPLPPSVWTHTILKRSVASGDLVAAILVDRRASLLYLGLSLLDAETLVTFEGAPDLLSALTEKHASVLAAFGGSVIVHDGVVQVPGGPETADAWTTMVGVPPSDPVRFVRLLLERDHGRLAYLFDSLMRLDTAHLLFALGGPADPTPRLVRLTALYDVFRRVSPEWDASRYPFYRPPVDPATILSRLRVTRDGRLTAPSSRALWELVLTGRNTLTDGSSQTADPGDDADAAWLLETVLAAGVRGASGRMAHVAFAQRVFARARSEQPGALADSIAHYRRFPALMLTLERLGVTDPSLYRRAARVATDLTRQGNLAIMAVFQASLAIVDRIAWTRGLESGTAVRLVGSLLAIDPNGSDYETRLAEWLSAELLPTLVDSTGAATHDEPAERVVLRGLAGIRAVDRTDARPVFDWSGRRYTVDVPASALARLEAIRQRQGPPSLDRALALFTAVTAATSGQVRGASTARVAELLNNLVAALPDIDQNAGLRGILGRAASRLTGTASAGARLDADVRRDLVRARLAVLADALTALAYLPALGDPDGPARLGGHVARRHVFTSPADLEDDEAEPAWRTPRETVGGDRGWHVEGSLLGLDEALASLALRRLDVDLIPAGPRLAASIRQQFVVDAARTRAFDLDDRERDLAAAALRAGRARIARLSQEPDSLGPAAAALGLEARRVQGLAWALNAGETDMAARFSFGELLALGAPQPLPFVAVTIPNNTCPKGAPSCPVELTDLSLRLVEGLARHHLPAGVLPGLLSPATQDFVDGVQPAYVGDSAAFWRYAHDLPDTRIDDYVASLESGPLRPAVPQSGGGGRR
jgi:hypothetical protein